MDEQALAILQRQVKTLRKQIVFFDHWHNTMHSPWHKRVAWWFMGYRLLSLGTWYRAPWNVSARKYDAY